MSSSDIKTDQINYQLEKIGRNILYVRYLPGCEITLPIIKEMVHTGNELMGVDKYFSLIDTKNSFGHIDKEAKQYIANSPDLNDVNFANAILIDTLAVRIIVRTYMKVDKPIKPAKIFKSEIKALEWLKGFGADIEQAKEEFS